MSVYHNFNIKIAEDVGVHSAIIYDYIYHCISQTDDTSHIQGNDWICKSVSELSKHFSYLTSRQISYAIKKLIDKEYIITNNFNDLAYDNTLWYAITKFGYFMMR